MADLVAIRKQWAPCPGRIQLWLKPKGCDRVHRVRRPENVPGWVREGVLVFKNALTGQPCSSVCPAKRSSLISRLLSSQRRPLSYPAVALQREDGESLGENQDRLNEAGVRHLGRTQPSGAGPSPPETARQEDQPHWVRRVRGRPGLLRSAFPSRRAALK